MNKKRCNPLLNIVFIIFFIIIGFLCSQLWEKSKEDKITITTSTIEENIQSLSQLSTASLCYRGIVKYEEGQIKFITKKGFTMIYDAYIKSGVDLSLVKVEINDKKININLPKAEVFDIYINPDSIEFYDESFAIFNWKDKEDIVLALRYAKEDVQNKINKEELENQAMIQARTIVESILSPLTQGNKPYEIEISFKNIRK